MDTTIDMVSHAQAMFVVPKRIFKKAHDRNKLKRRMKEAYRLCKSDFYNSLAQTNKKIILAFIYTAKKKEDFLTIENSVKKLLEQAVKGKRV